MQSVTLDRWGTQQISITLAGGNQKFENYLRDCRVNKPVKYQSSQLADVLETYRQRLVRESQNEAIQNRLRDFIKSKGLPEEKISNEVVKEVQ